MINLGKKIFYTLWLVMVILFLLLYLKNPEIATPEYIEYFIKSYGDEMLMVYIGLTFLRGLFLIPSTPFVVGGAMIFPEQLFMVLTISMTGIIFSATTLYYFSDILGFSTYLEKKHSISIHNWKNRLRSPNAIFYVLGWSFFPLVPTDLICYVAGIVKMPYKYLFIGVFVGELTLVIIYVYFGANL